MAASFLLVFLLCATTVQFSASLVLPVTKHAASNQYFTRVGVGTRSEPINLLIDLSNPILWLDCASPPTSQSQTPIQCLSIRCSTAAPDVTGCSSVNHTATSQQPQPCVLHPTNPILKSTGKGELVVDTITIGFQHEETDSIAESFKFEIEDFLLTCVPPSLVQGLGRGTRGVFGLGKNSRISSISQIAHKLDISRKFSLCLPGKGCDGAIFAGTVPIPVAEMSRSMVYTPLLMGESGPSDDYSILVKSVEINGRKVSLPGSRIRARLSSVDPYSKVGSGIYRALVRGFTAATELLDLTRVEEGGMVVGDGLFLEHCYYKKHSGGVTVEVDKFPVIDLVLQSEMVKWRINGHNSMVVGDEEKVVCLGFIDGGLDVKDDEILIGAYQMEDKLLEFDLGSGMLGIGSSLRAKGTSCSELSRGGSQTSHPAS